MIGRLHPTHESAWRRRHVAELVWFKPPSRHKETESTGLANAPFDNDIRSSWKVFPSLFLCWGWISSNFVAYIRTRFISQPLSLVPAFICILEWSILLRLFPCLPLAKAMDTTTEDDNDTGVDVDPQEGLRHSLRGLHARRRSLSALSPQLLALTICGHVEPRASAIVAFPRHTSTT
jgi:hypothetical protein